MTDQAFDPPEQRLAQPGRRPRQRQPEGRKPERQAGRQQGQRGQRDQGQVQHDTNRWHQMKPQHHQGQGHEPDQRRGDQTEHDPASQAPRRLLPERFEPTFEGIDRVETSRDFMSARVNLRTRRCHVQTKPPRHGRHAPEQGRDRQKRELAADIKEVRRIEQKHHDGRRGQNVGGLRAAVEHHGQADHHGHHRRPDHRRNPADEGRVTDCRQRHASVNPLARQPQQLQRQADPEGQGLHVQAGNRQQMAGAGPGEGVVDVGIDGLSPTEQQGRGQGRDLRVEPRQQPRLAPGPQPAQPSGRGPIRSLRVEPEARRLVDRHPKPDSLGPQVVSTVILPWISWFGDRFDRSGGHHRLAHGEVGPVARDQKLEPPRGRVPPLAIAEARRGQNRAGHTRVIGPLAGPELGHLDEHAANPGRRRVRPVAPREVVGGEVRPPPMVPSGSQRRDRYDQRQPGNPAPTGPKRHQRNHRQPKRDGAPGGGAPGRPRTIGHDPQRQRQSDGNQRCPGASGTSIRFLGHVRSRDQARRERPPTRPRAAFAAQRNTPISRIKEGSSARPGMSIRSTIGWIASGRASGCGLRANGEPR